MKTCLFLSDDLFFSSRIQNAAEQSGWRLQMLPTEQSVVAFIGGNEYQLVILDLACGEFTAQNTIQIFEDDEPRIIAYASHVQEAMIEEAKQSGCDLVLTRGQLDAQVNSFFD